MFERIFGTGVLTTIHLIGALQGLALGAALLFRSSARVANRWLALLIVLFSVDMGALYLLNVLGPEKVPHLVGVTDPLTFVYAPAMFLYACTLIGGDRTPRRGWLHLLPALAMLAYTAPLLLSGAEAKIAHVRALEAGRGGPGFPSLGVIVISYSCVYLVASYLRLRRHAASIRDRFSSIEQMELQWLRFLLLGFLVLWGVSLLFFLFDRIRTGDGSIIFVGVTIFIYAMGYQGLRQPEVFTRRDDGEPSPPADPPKYEKTRLDDDHAETIRDDLLALMERDHPYRRAGLTLQELADLSGTPPHQLSQVINNKLGCNFYDFVNRFRVEDVCRRLDDPDEAHLTVLALALDAGFASKSTFNAIFKKHTGTTPSRYRARRKV